MPRRHSENTTSQMAIQSRVCSAMLSMMVPSSAVITRLAETIVCDKNSGR
ncbi:Uncharacterised protein [Mycobacteroides abscessus subsp. abscessus]|nr:Uncharacterised protein [Mycobacteroides abscessus subsp. abscessus]